MADWQFFNATERCPRESWKLAFLAAAMFLLSGLLQWYGLWRGRSLTIVAVGSTAYLALVILWIAIGMRWRRKQRADELRDQPATNSLRQR